MQRSPRSLVVLLVACLVLVACSWFEHGPDQLPERTHAVHAPTRVP